ncbi:DnaJ-domain-containing protein [Mollisia scopiformis]|uniref:DnaJ-domain-containing protein n=1 Tax=Mollisia scopiformis TaxID=149040 RepID=A0A194XAQ4_MOLSC|nr:DnaJ-domain-containing protein [Mollisia scopiformis]KUJ17255.1 DnaJ-domain-containing protein [Mollisia scopiformis]
MAPHSKELHTILGLPQKPEPSLEAIRKAYYGAALKYHPDKNPGDTNATAKFQELKKAHETILSRYVTIEEECDVDISETCYTEDKQLTFDKKPKRVAKKVEKAKRRAENEESQANARANKFFEMKKLAREVRELLTLEKEIECETLRLENKQPCLGQRKEDIQPMTADYHRRALTLAKAQLNGRNRKKPRPEINLDTRANEKMILGDVFEEFETDRRNENSLEFEIPLERVDFERERQVKQNRNLSSLASETEVRQDAQVLAEKVNRFWSTKASNSEQPNVARDASKVERPDDTDCKFAAAAYTREHLAMFAQMSGNPEHSNVHAVQVYEDPIAQNDNLSQSHYCDPLSRKGRWKEGHEVRLEHFPRGKKHLRRVRWGPAEVLYTRI